MTHTDHHCRRPGHCGTFRPPRASKLLQRERLLMRAVTMPFVSGVEAFWSTGHEGTLQPSDPASLPPQPSPAISSGQSWEELQDFGVREEGVGL